MGLTVQDEGNNMVLMKVAGLLKKSEFDAAQAEGAKKLNSGDTLRLLIILEDFKGWDKGEQVFASAVCQLRLAKGLVSDGFTGHYGRLGSERRTAMDGSARRRYRQAF